MSKGHLVPAQYAALATLDVLLLEELRTLKQLGSRLQGHPAMHETPGLEACTGALGEGLSYANGIFEIGKMTMLRAGGDVAIFASGHMVCKALDAADLLAGNGIQASVTNVATIMPLDEAAVYQAAKDVALPDRTAHR
jgi:transketolase